jgi:hypothetical protein
MYKKFRIDELSYRHYSEEFIINQISIHGSNDLFWILISQYQTLSEEFINRYRSKLSWYSLSEFQNMSEEFMIRHINYIKLKKLERNKKIPKEVKQSIVNLITIIDL